MRLVSWVLVWLVLAGLVPRVFAQGASCDEGSTRHALEGLEPVHHFALGRTTLTYIVTAEADVDRVFVSLSPWVWGYIHPDTSAGWTTVDQGDEAAAGICWEDGVQADETKTYHLVLEGYWNTEPGTGQLRVTGCSTQNYTVPIAWNWVPAAEPTQPAVVYGYTWEDTDRDGRWSEGEPAISGHTAMLWRAAEQLPEGGGEPPLVAVGDETGLFRFELKAPGEVILVQDTNEGWEPTTPTTITVTVGPGGDTGPYNFGVYRVGQNPPQDEPALTAPTSQPPPSVPSAEAAPPPEVPEPSSLALMLGGIGAVAAWIGTRMRR